MTVIIKSVKLRLQTRHGKDRNMLKKVSFTVSHCESLEDFNRQVRRLEDKVSKSCMSLKGKRLWVDSPGRCSWMHSVVGVPEDGGTCLCSNIERHVEGYLFLLFTVFNERLDREGTERLMVVFEIDCGDDDDKPYLRLRFIENGIELDTIAFVETAQENEIVDEGALNVKTLDFSLFHCGDESKQDRQVDNVLADIRKTCRGMQVALLKNKKEPCIWVQFIGGVPGFGEKCSCGDIEDEIRSWLAVQLRGLTRSMETGDMVCRNVVIEIVASCADWGKSLSLAISPDGIHEVGKILFVQEDAEYEE